MAQDGDLSQFETDMWTNTFFGGVSSVIESGEGVYTPYLSGSYTINDYLLDDLGDFNYNTTFLLVCTRTMVVPPLISHKVDYNMDGNTEFDTEDFSEFFPQIGLITTLQPSDTISLKTTVGIGYHSTTIVEAGASRPEDLLDNVEVYAVFSPSFLILISLMHWD